MTKGVCERIEAATPHDAGQGRLGGLMTASWKQGGACWVVAMCVLATAASGQVSNTPAPIVVAIEVDEVVTSADEAAARLRSFEPDWAASSEVIAIANRLPAVRAEIDAHVTSLSRDTRTRRSLDAFDAEESAWRALQVELPVWLELLGHRTAALTAAVADLARMEERWVVTGRRLAAEGAPPALLQSATTVLEQIEPAERAVSQRRLEVLTLQAEVAAQNGRIARALDEIAFAREQRVRRVFQRDAPALWARGVLEPVTMHLGLQLREGSQVARERIAEFVDENEGGLILHAALLAGLVLALRSARTRVRQRTEEEKGLRRVADVFELPYSMAALIGLGAAPWLYPHVPLVLGQLLGAVALVPTVRLVRRFIEPALVPLVNALIVFYLLDRLRELAEIIPVLSRLILLLEMSAGALMIGWLLRPARLREVPAYAERGRLYLVGLACRGALGVMLVAIVSESLGYSALGRLLGDAVLESAYLAVVLYAGVRIFDSLVTFALRVRPLGALGMVQRTRFAMAARIHKGAVWGAGLLWLVGTLDRFAIRSPVFEAVERFVTAELVFGNIALSLADLVAFGLTIWLSFQLSRFVRFALEEDVYPRLSLERGIPYAASRFVHFVILGFGFFLAVAAMGLDLNRFVLLAGALGVGIGFGLQNVVDNFVSGLILLTERPVQVGDTIETEGLLGEVQRIGIRSSTVRTRNGAELIVPNGQLVSSQVTNWTLSDALRRVEVTVGVAYGTDVPRVLSLLEGVAVANPDVLSDPAPQALFRGFGDSSLDFELRVWTAVFDQFARVQSELNVAVDAVLCAEDIEIPFPQRDLNLRTVDPEAGERLTRSDPKR
jgi:small-conductance mechanosensitive channel